MAASSSTRIRSIDFRVIDKVFGMEGGYVLDFSNRTFAEFFREELGVDINDPRWEAQGGSKAKRLRYYLRQADHKAALNTLNALWEYREASSVTANYPRLEDTLRAAYFRIVERLGGKAPEPAAATAAPQEQPVDAATTSALAARRSDLQHLIHDLGERNSMFVDDKRMPALQLC